MKWVAISIIWLALAIGVLFIPISFSVDGFGLVVSPGGVKTIRAREPGIVYHFPATDQEFVAGQIVSAVMRVEDIAENAFLKGTLRRDLAKIDSDHLEKTTKVLVDLERDRAKMSATDIRFQSRLSLTGDMQQALDELKDFTQISDIDIEALNAERLSQLDKLEGMLRKSGENSALPEQRLAAMLDDVQTEKLSVISSKGAQFVSERMILDLVKDLTELQFSNSIDQAEIKILSDKIEASQRQRLELINLKNALEEEAYARYLARLKVPQIEIARGVSLDMRKLQPSRADVARGDPLRILSERVPSEGLHIIVYGNTLDATVTFEIDGSPFSVILMNGAQHIKQALLDQGVEVDTVNIDRQNVGEFEISSIFIAYDKPTLRSLKIVSIEANSVEGFPVSVTHDYLRGADNASDGAAGYSNTIIGFLENRHSISLEPNQAVQGRIHDLENGDSIEFDGHLLERDFATVDTQELGIRLGNQSLAAKIIARGVLSQVTIEIDREKNENVQKMAGAVVRLSFPIGSRSLFSLLWTKDAEI